MAAVAWAIEAAGSIAAAMAIRLLATYQWIDNEGKAGQTVRLPVVGCGAPDANGREREHA